MNKAELMEKMAKEAKVSKAAAGRALEGMIGAITDAVKNDDSDGLQRQVNRYTSTSSFDTLGIPKPAVLSHDLSLLRNLQKPNLKNGMNK